MNNKIAKAFDKGYDSAYRHAGFRVDNNPYKVNTKSWLAWEAGFKIAYKDQYPIKPTLQICPVPLEDQAIL